jgi:DNA-binding PadR family transcriptional regulator
MMDEHPTSDQFRLGDFEAYVLQAVWDNDGNAYGVTIRRAVDQLQGKTASLGAVYTTLDRLERKGYITSWMGEPVPERGGRSKKLYRIDGNGMRALKHKRQHQLRMADLLTGGPAITLPGGLA